MKIYAINGSPRKNGNTAILLKKALEGAISSKKDEKIETEIISLYDLQYTGCKSCFACKLLHGKSYGKCIIKDDIQEILEKLSKADAIIFGSPVYFRNISGQLKSFLERFLFPYLVYDSKHSSLAPKKMPIALIYTMNVTKEKMEFLHYPSTFHDTEIYFEKLLTKPVVMYSNNTYQFNDYSKYKADGFSKEEKEKHRKLQFPLDCKEAFSLGKSLLN